MNNSIISLVVGLILIMSISGVAASTADYTAVDTDHSLTNKDKIQEFKTDGKASTDLISPNMTVTIKKDLKKKGILRNTQHTYIEFNYDEEKKRVVRIYIPKDYFKPYNSQIKSVDGKDTAQIYSVRDRKYAALKVTFDGDETQVYAISKFTGFSSSVTDSRFDSLSGLLGSNQEKYNPAANEWQYIDSSQIDSSTEIKVKNINGDYSIQYLKSTGKWVTVPSTQTEKDPYYIQTRDGVKTSVWVISTDSKTPQIRYKQSQTTLEQASEISNGIQGIGKSILDDINKIINGDIL